MGSYISQQSCSANFGITVNCGGPVVQNGRTVAVGDVQRGQFESDPDIAGIGIVAVFMAVTTFALFISVIDILWLMVKYSGFKKRHSRYNKRRRLRVSVTDVYETLILSCSDQQVFTGAAYVVTLRYYKGCQVAAYHYNVVANMMLLTCATHLMSVTVVRNYWRYPVLSLLRVLVITGVFLATGLMFSNQNVDKGFPTQLPAATDGRGSERPEDTLLFLPAACFMGGTSLSASVGSAASSGQSFIDALVNSSTSASFIQGWSNFLVMGIWYGAVVVAELFRLVGRGRHRAGWRRNLVDRVRRLAPVFSRRPKLKAPFLALYWMIGFAISAWTVVTAGRYIIDLRAWVGASGWIQLEDGQTNPEDEAASFGQLVPIFMTSLTLFSFIQVIHEKYSFHKKWKKWQKMDDSEYDPESPWSMNSSSNLDKKTRLNRLEGELFATRTNTADSFMGMADRSATASSAVAPTIPILPPASIRGSPPFPQPPSLRSLSGQPPPRERQYSGVSAVTVPLAFEGPRGPSPPGAGGGLGAQRGNYYSVGTTR